MVAWFRPARSGEVRPILKRQPRWLAVANWDGSTWRIAADEASTGHRKRTCGCSAGISRF